MGNFIGEYKNAISDEIVDALRDLMDSGKEFHTYGEIGTGQIDRKVKDSNDLNALDVYSEEESPEMSAKQKHVHDVILPKLSVELDKCLLEYTKEYPSDVHIVNALDNDDDILEVFYQKYSFWPMSILMKKYHKGVQGYHYWHEDQGDSVPHVYRAFVVMFYLNDVEEGGETEFYNQKVKVKPEKGKVVIFPTAWTHLHRGNIPKSGDKYIANFWVLKGSNSVKPTIAGKWNIGTDFEKR
tara:strand:+ start:348 stop:1067 length:720 start_codon:yes stop_codon:yes gene_type:complete